MNTNTSHLRDLLQRATPGEWDFRSGMTPHYQGSIYATDGDGRDIALTYNDESGANTELLSLTPTLAEEVVKLREALEKACECLDIAADDTEEAGYPSRAEGIREDVDTYRALLSKHK